MAEFILQYGALLSMFFIAGLIASGVMILFAIELYCKYKGIPWDDAPYLDKD